MNGVAGVIVIEREREQMLLQNKGMMCLQNSDKQISFKPGPPRTHTHGHAGIMVSGLFCRLK